MNPVKRILVVDDNAMNWEIIQEIVGDEYIVLTATNGVEAIAVAKHYRPRIVLLDVMLPGIDGYTVCRQLRAMPTMYHARIIMVTAKAMPSERAQGFEAGADAYITKPFEDDELIAAMRPALVSSKLVESWSGCGTTHPTSIELEDNDNESI